MCCASSAQQLQDPGRHRRLRRQWRPAGAAQPSRPARHPRRGLSHRSRPGARQRIPNDPELPLPLDKVHPIHEVVKIDYFLPGCPPSGGRHLEVPHRPARRPHARPGPRPAALRLSRNHHELRTGNRHPPREPAPRRHRARVARRGPRQGHDPARRRQQGASGAPAHRRIPRLRELHPGPALLGSAGHGAAPVRHLPGLAPPGRLQGAGHDGRRHS